LKICSPYIKRGMEVKGQYLLLVQGFGNVRKYLEKI
jgi:hypothetical protein